MQGNVYLEPGIRPVFFLSQTNSELSSSYSPVHVHLGELCVYTENQIFEFTTATKSTRTKEDNFKHMTAFTLGLSVGSRHQRP